MNPHRCLPVRIFLFLFYFHFHFHFYFRLIEFLTVL